ncbi:MAG: M56 family metallopeptidase, partial [Ginsengibacter sp.]
MPSLFLFLIKINAVLLLFAIAYFLVLRRLTFYTINRYFLLIGIVFSSMYPFIDLTKLFAKQNQISLDLVPAIYTSDALNNSANPFYWNVLSLVFYAGMTLLLVRFLIQLFSLFRVHQNSYPGHINHYPIRVLNEKINPFSFWNSIYINPEIHSQSDLQTILAHEKIHVQQKHTIDIILSELSVIIYWFNPGVWLIKKAVKENIEFIADAEVLKKGIEKKVYQYDLLKVETGHSALALVNAFSISGLKKRIQMMNVKRSSPYKMIVYFILLPVVIVFALAFTISKKDILAVRVLKNTV